MFRRLRKMIKKYKKIQHETVPAKKRLKSIGGGYLGSRKEYKETVLSYWKKYGVKPKRLWYSLYCNGQDKYDPRFIPESMWVCTIRPYFNDFSLSKAYVDKGMFNRLFPNVRKPETIVKKMGGYYYNGDGEELISREEAERLCAQEEHLIFKPSLNSYGGKNIVFYDRNDKNTQKISSIFDAMKGGFVAQRILKQHPDLKRLNPDSLNTVRVLSFHFKEEIHILSAQLRIGGTGSRVDNISSGGSACAIKPDGWLHEKSVTRKSTWTDETASGIKLKDIRVPHYEEIKETVCRLHRTLPYFNLIGWDFAVAEDGSPVLIEFNVRPGQNQIGGREPTFGDMTDEVLDEVFIKKTLKNAFKR